ncbi:Very-long-chain 3-oxoacyl-CoA reductase 1 [Acorus calamus]|uniref:Very-long-chain 3-oxoacyl-CoA reductase 1 n=1 Tax=Acorus calamus TaxID=4465 RepID=A0AAV9F0B7_ACOCL|nr:Very-long-chain 3-oxoacyl-CoA reductase 1 [Acorus calamus]
MNQPTWLLPLTTIGLLTTIRLTLSFLRCLYVFFLRPPKNLKSYGSWAVVTGPTSGIGKAFSVELAKQGLNLLLIGRNPDKLSALSAALTSEFRVKTKTVLVDFSGDDMDDGVRRIEEAVVGLEVGVLINNAGVSDPTARMVHEVVGVEEMVRVNVEGATRVAKAVLVGMVKRGRGAVVNLGSGSSVVLPSHPYYALYASTKAYIDQFSRSLYVEYKQMGIDVQCQK